MDTSAVPQTRGSLQKQDERLRNTTQKIGSSHHARENCVPSGNDSISIQQIARTSRANLNVAFAPSFVVGKAVRASGIPSDLGIDPSNGDRADLPQQFFQHHVVERFDQVMTEAGLFSTQAIGFTTPARLRDQHGATHTR
jgi:hypothetical protein